MQRRFWLTFVSISLTQFAPHPVTAAESSRPLSVDGVVRFRSFDRGNHAVIDEEHSFRWRGVSCKWNLKLSLPNDKAYDYHVVTYDGDRLFAVTSLESVARRLRAEGSGGGANDFTAVLLRSPVPRLLEGHPAASVWLTYGSGCYLGSRTNDLAEPPFSLSATRDSLQTGAEWLLHFENEWVTREGGITSHLIYWDTMPGSPDGRRWTNATYTLLGSVDVSGQVVPTNSALRILSMPIDGPQRVLYEYNLNATSVSVSEPITISSPHIPGTAIVSDGRFARDPATPGMVTYMRKGSFPTDAEVRGMPDFGPMVAANKEMAGRLRLIDLGTSGKPTGSRFRSILSLLTGTLVVVCSLLILFKNKKSRKKTNTHRGQIS